MNKKMLLLPILGSFLLTGCKFSLFGKTIYLFEKPKDKEPEVIPDVDPEDMHQHATSLSYSTGSPNAPFYLKVGETRNLGVTLSPSPDLDNEKTCNWKIDNAESVSYEVDSTDSKKVTVTGVKTGTSKLTVTNDYNRNLTYTFTIKVIDYDEDNDYLWQYTSEDRKGFGYIYQTRPEGVTEGDASLNGINWHFTRSKAVTLQSSMGAVGFGRGGEPETHIHLECDNIRTVENFTIEAASANSLAKMTVKVGDTVFINDATVPADYYDTIGTIYSDKDVTPSNGKIEIDIVTPEYDPAKEADPTYKKPGAFYLKSMFINFADDVIPAHEKTYNFKALYEDQESTFYNSLSSSGKQVSYADETFSFNFKSIKTESDKVPGYAVTNGDIEIKPLFSDEVFYKVEAKFNFGELTTKSSYIVEKSKTGGLIYSSTGIASDKETGELKVLFFEDHLNMLRLKVSGSSYIGLESIKVTTVKGSPLTVKKIAVPEEFTPTKTQYMVGDEFSTEGLPDLEIEFNEEGIRPETLSVNALTWYDGTSYDADPSKAKTQLELGTTKVCGVYNGQLVVTITGITVLDNPQNLTLVKNVSEIDTTSHYYIIARVKGKLIRGSAGSSMGGNSDAGQGSLAANVGESVSISAAFRNDYYVFEKESEKFAVKSTTGHYFGITKSGNLSRSAKPDNKYFTLTMDADGLMTIAFEKPDDSSVVKYLALGSSAIGLQTEVTANLSLYKVAA